MEQLTALPKQEEYQAFAEKHKDAVIYIATKDEKVIVNNNGDWLPKDKLNEKIEENKTLKAQIESTTTELKNLKKEFKDVDGFKEKVEKLEADKTAMEKKLKDMNTTFAVKEAYLKLGVKDNYLDFIVSKEHPDLSAVQLNEKGEFVLGEDKSKTLKETYKEIIGTVVIKGKNPDGTTTEDDPPKKSYQDELKDAFH